MLNYNNISIWGVGYWYVDSADAPSYRKAPEKKKLSHVCESGEHK